MEPRQKYEDKEMWEVTGKDVVQLKYDGIWCLAHVHDGKIDYWSRHGKLKKSEELTDKIPDGKYIGELMFGSQWAIETGKEGLFYVFDCIEIRGCDIRVLPYVERVGMYKAYLSDLISTHSWNLVHNYPFHQAKALWDECVVDAGFEGLVYRSSNGTWDEVIARQKATFTVDLEIVDFEEGEGRLAGTLGALICRRIGEDSSQASPLIRIGGGMSDAFRHTLWLEKGQFSSRIIAAECKRIFASGSLRHPQFLNFHYDKNPHSFIQKYGQLK